MAPKKGLIKKIFHPCLSLLFLDPGSGMGKNQDPGSGINIPDPQHCYPLSLANVWLSGQNRKVSLQDLQNPTKMTFRRRENPGKWLGLDKATSEILKPLKMVLCSSREIVSLKNFWKTCRASSILQRIEGVTLAPQFKWMDL